MRHSWRVFPYMVQLILPTLGAGARLCTGFRAQSPGRNSPLVARGQLGGARKMTQADLAAPDFTKGFISLLETGRTRVSLRAAEILAQRLGVSSADLIAGGDGEADLELALLRAEQQLSAGRAVDAIEVLERLANKATGSLRERTLRARGRALVQGGRPREGLVFLEEAGRAFEAIGQREVVIRTTYARALAS